MPVSRIAVAQMTATADKDANFDACQRLISKAKGENAQLVCLPENFAYFAESGEELVEQAEPLDGPWFKRYRDLAVQNKVWLSLGGFPERSAAHPLPFNSHVIVTDTGEIHAIYRKIHLFRLLIDTKAAANEASYVTPGNGLVVCPSPFGKMGLSICYDLRFGEMFSAMANAGAQLMLTPAAFTEITGKDHWELLVRTRAVESQSYAIAAAQTGKHNEKRSCHGHAMIVNPWGAIIAQCQEGEGIALANIDLDYVSEVRRRIPVLADRRTDVYCSTSHN